MSRIKENFEKYGFETLETDNLEEYNSTGILLRHKKSGAEVYKINTEDEENLFAFIFKTPPSDHTGAAHIMEHTVLCGSENYPLKDPFLVLLKSSAHTFLNAMTYPDKTVYPASSTVKADFLNLFRVYGDAVFFPLLKKEAFEQEGHHLEFDSLGRLIRSGIVLNEMKGSYSSPESVAGDWTLRSLFPDTPYRWDSGGDPEHIPELTYRNFLNFHKKYYHPSNAKIFLYGNHSLDEILPVLDSEFLSRFSYSAAAAADSDIPLQTRWDAPKRFEAFWPSQSGDSEENKSTISVNWLLDESSDPEKSLSMQVLSFILLGHSGSPLQKAIIESSLGQDISPVSGLEDEIRQMVFSAALRGTGKEKTEDFELLIEKTLQDIVKTGLDNRLVEGALRTVEFRNREIKGGIPFGMRLMKRALRGWLHGRLPSETLAFEKPVKELRSRIKPGYFENIIREQMLENNHRSTVVTSPDPELQAKRDAAERAELDKLQEELEKGTNEGGFTLEGIKQSLENLKVFQETPDSPEDLSKIPFLSRSDLPEEVKKIPVEKINSGGTEIYTHSTFTNGIIYADFAFSLDNLEPELQYWMPLFGRALTDVGLPGREYDEVAKELALKTGGLGCSLEASMAYSDTAGSGGTQNDGRLNRVSLNLFIRLKALYLQWEEASAITGELLKSADFTDKSRIKDLLFELRNDYRSAVIPSGHSFASLRSACRHSVASSWEDLWYGVEQLLFLERMTKDPDAPEKASEALIKIQREVLQKDRLSLIITSDKTHLQHAAQITAGMLNTSLYGKEYSAEKNTAAGKADGKNTSELPQLFRHKTTGESLYAASNVSFSSLSLPVPVLGTPSHAYLGLLSHILGTGYLWENIRMKGGAYGAFASVSGLDGVFSFVTYRDPLIVPSLIEFKKSLEWIISNLDDETLNKAVIGSVGKELKPQSPGEKSIIALKRILYGISDSKRQRRRNFQLKASAADVTEEAGKLLEKWNERSVSVIASKSSLEEAASEMPELSESAVELPV